MAQRDTRKRGEMPPKSGFMGVFLSIFLMMASSAFESLFAQATSQDSSGGGAGYDPFGNSGGESDRAQKVEKELKDAFQFFDCSLSEVQASSSSEREETRSLLKKKWRKLSLLHHPDRNGSSEESVLLMQQLNHHYSLACLEIDRLEGIVHDDDADEDESSFAGTPDASTGESSEGEDYDDDDDEEDDDDGENMEELFRKQMNDLKKEGNRVKQAIQKTAKEQKRVNNKKRRNRNKGRTCSDSLIPNLFEVTTSESGRDKAHNAWVRDTSAYVTHNASVRDTHKQEDAADTPEPERPEDAADTPEPEKPKHLLFESSTDDIALAIRLGKIEAVSVLIYAKVVNWQWLHNVRDHQEALIEVLQLPIDKDGNTILHYAAYYESSGTVDRIMMLVGVDYPDIVLKQNYREQHAVDLCVASTNDGFKERMEQITQSARDAFDKKLDDKRLWSQLKRINVLGSLYSLLAFALIGRLVFGCGNVVSFAICLSHASAMKVFKLTDADSHHADFLFILHVFWKLLLSALSLLRVQPIPLYLLVPTGILLGCVNRDSVAKTAIRGLLRMSSIISRSLDRCAGFLRLNVAIPRVAGSNKILAKCLYLLAYGLIALACKWLHALMKIFQGGNVVDLVE
jgi:curved DNA-binding protein CbpA